MRGLPGRETRVVEPVARASEPTLKFSTNTSASLAISTSRAASSARVRSRAIERLLRLAQVKCAASRSPLAPWNQRGPKLRVSSPVPGRSTLMTSAPRSARSCVAQGPASTRLVSTTRMPLKARGTAEDSVTSTVSCIERECFHHNSCLRPVTRQRCLPRTDCDPDRTCRQRRRCERLSARKRNAGPFQ